jgi:hypothetical protein
MEGGSALAGKKKSGGKTDEPNPEFQNFQRLLKDTLAVPKEELDKKRREYNRGRDKRRTG